MFFIFVVNPRTSVLLFVTFGRSEQLFLIKNKIINVPGVEVGARSELLVRRHLKFQNLKEILSCLIFVFCLSVCLFVQKIIFNSWKIKSRRSVFLGGSIMLPRIFGNIRELFSNKLGINWKNCRFSG